MGVAGGLASLIFLVFVRRKSLYLDRFGCKTGPQGPVHQVIGIMPVRLSEELLDSLKPTVRDQYLFCALLSPFAYRLTPSGTGIFYVGKRPRRRVGSRPPLKVADARELAHQMLADLRAGRDPVLARQARQRAAAAGKITVAQ